MSGASRRRRQNSQIHLNEMDESDELVRPLRHNCRGVEEIVSRTLKFYDLNLGYVQADEATTKMTVDLADREPKAIKEEIEEIKKDIHSLRNTLISSTDERKLPEFELRH